MKKIIIITLLIPLFIGCNKQKIVTLEARNDSLIQQNNLNEESINEFLATLNGIQENLNTIKTKENIITEHYDSNIEMKHDVKERINNDITAIYNLLTDTRSKLDDAKNKLGKSNFRINEFEKMIANFTRDIELKDSALLSLRTEIENMNIQLASLNQNVGELKLWNEEKEDIIASQVEIIDNKDVELNTAYYTVGTKKELKEENIITAEGGFIGIGKAEKLNQSLDEKLFTRIDKRQVIQIPLPGKKQEIVTPHDTTSYKISWEKDQRVLKIVDQDKFWKSSKYLVVINN
jgi:chromosome segregation ATPase